MKRAFLLFLSAAAALRADSTATKTRTVTKLADGVYEIRHPDAPDTFPQSNTTVVIGDRGVLVVDSGLLPSTAREDVAQIRRWTDKPVTWLLNTHWHFDHTLGNATYQAAFPAVQIVATRHDPEDDRRLQPRGPDALSVARRALQEDPRFGQRTPTAAPSRRETARTTSDRSRASRRSWPRSATPSRCRPTWRSTASSRSISGTGGSNCASSGAATRPATPSRTCRRRRSWSRATFWCIRFPYLFGGFPVDHPKTLRAMAELDAQTIVPGHGEILRDKKYIYQVAEFLEAVGRRHGEGGRRRQDARGSAGRASRRAST